MGSPNDKPPPMSAVAGLLRRGDQVAVAGVVVLLLATSLGWFWTKGGRGRLIEIDQAQPRAVPFLVDINRAEVPELLQLPDIGPTLAQRIVDSRRQDGPYRDLDDLVRVRGIGLKTLDRLRPFLVPIPDDEAVAGVAPREAGVAPQQVD